MRIIAGIYRSRVIQSPDGYHTRPSSDRLRETLFNVLAPRIAGARFADLYAGSGAVGLEAVSRGASQVTFVEKARSALLALRGNLQSLQIADGFSIHAESVRSFLAAANPARPALFDIIFLDPPYDAAEEYEATLGTLGRAGSPHLATGALVIAEHRRKSNLQECFGALQRTRLLQQGDAALSFYSAANASRATA